MPITTDQAAQVRRLADGSRTRREIVAATGATYHQVYRLVRNEGLAVADDPQDRKAPSYVPRTSSGREIVVRDALTRYADGLADGGKHARTVLNRLAGASADMRGAA